MAPGTPNMRLTPQLWRTPLIAWLASRAIVVGAAIAGSLALGRPPGSKVDPAVPHAVSFLGSWDSAWYLDIARHGYESGSTNIHLFTDFAFYPGLPMVMRLGFWTHTNPFAWGLAASNLAFLAGLIAISAIVGDRWGTQLASRAVWATAFAPPAVYSVLAYTDGLLFGVAACAAWAALRNRWLLAGLLAGAAVLVRPQGLLVAVLLFLLAWTLTAPGVGRRLTRTALGVVPALVAIGGFVAWVQDRHGSWTLPFRAQHAWGRTGPGIATLHNLWAQVAAIFDYPFTSNHRPLREACYLCSPVGWTGPIRDFVATVVMIALVVALARFVGSWKSPWVIYAMLAVITPLATGTLNSMSRFGLLAFPLAWPVAGWIERGGETRGRWMAIAAAGVMVALTIQIHAVAP